VSVKRAGFADPAFAHTMSGRMLLFQVVHSVRRRVHSSGEVTSAEMVWKRCFDGSFAAAWSAVQLGVVDGDNRGRGSY